MSHVGVQRLAAGHGQEDRAQDQESVKAIDDEEVDGMRLRPHPYEFYLYYDA